MSDMDNSQPNWHKSIWSDDNGCIELAVADDQVLVRNSRDVTGPVLIFTQREWDAFAKGVQDGSLTPEG